MCVVWVLWLVWNLSSIGHILSLSFDFVITEVVLLLLFMCFVPFVGESNLTCSSDNSIGIASILSGGALFSSKNLTIFFFSFLFLVVVLKRRS